jgi:hypothetical protein
MRYIDIYCSCGPQLDLDNLASNDSCAFTEYNLLRYYVLRLLRVLGWDTVETTTKSNIPTSRYSPVIARDLKTDNLLFGDIRAIVTFETTGLNPSVVNEHHLELVYQAPLCRGQASGFYDVNSYRFWFKLPLKLTGNVCSFLIPVYVGLRLLESMVSYRIGSLLILQWRYFFTCLLWYCPVTSPCLIPIYLGISLHEYQVYSHSRCLVLLQ